MKKAFLIIDMSNDFVADDGSLTAGKPAQAIVPAILQTAENYRLKGEPVVFCMDSHKKNDDHFRLWPAHNVAGTYGAQLYGPLAAWYEKHKDEENVLFLPKSEYDAFYMTPLAQILRDHGCEGVRAAGVCTDICVFLTVYGAYKAGFATEAAAGECATFTDNQQIFLKQMNAIYKTELV